MGWRDRPGLFWERFDSNFNHYRSPWGVGPSGPLGPPPPPPTDDPPLTDDPPIKVPNEAGAVSICTSSLPISRRATTVASLKDFCEAGPRTFIPTSKSPVTIVPALSSLTDIGTLPKASMICVPIAAPSPSRPYVATVTVRFANGFNAAPISPFCLSSSRRGAVSAYNMAVSRCASAVRRRASAILAEKDPAVASALAARSLASPASSSAILTLSLDIIRSSVPMSSVALATKNSPATPITTRAHANTSNISFLTLGRSGDRMVARRNAWRSSQKSKNITPSSRATPTTTIPVQKCNQRLSTYSQCSSSEDLIASAFNSADVAILESRRTQHAPHSIR